MPQLSQVTSAGVGLAAAAARGHADTRHADSSAAVAAVLKDAGLHMHTITLLESGFDDLERLSQIEDSDMKDLGIPPLHATRLRRTVNELKRMGSRRELDVSSFDPSNPVAVFLQEAGLEQYTAALLQAGFDDIEAGILSSCMLLAPCPFAIHRRSASGGLLHSTGRSSVSAAIADGPNTHIAGCILCV